MASDKSPNYTVNTPDNLQAGSIIQGGEHVYTVLGWGRSVMSKVKMIKVRSPQTEGYIQPARVRAVFHRVQGLQRSQGDKYE